MNRLKQMRFKAPHGRREVLWVEGTSAVGYRVLNVPVWRYGVSVGTLVSGAQGVDGVLEYRDLVEPSPGGTVRVMVPENGPAASQLYLNRLGPEATQRGIGIGPATFLDPLIVAINLHNRNQWRPEFAQYLNDLAEEGVVDQWEMGDPDQSEDGDDEPETFTSELIHPRPTSSREKFFRL